MQWYQKQENEEESFSNIFSIRILLAVLVGLLSFTLLVATGALSAKTSLIIAVTLLPEGLCSLAMAYHLRHGNTFKPALKLMFNAVFMLFIIIIRGKDLTVIEAYTAFLIGDIPALLFLFPLHKLKKLTVPSSPISTLISSGKYALLNYTSLAYARADALVVRAYLGSSSLGFYGLAYRYLEYLSIFSSSFVQTFFPTAAKKEGIALKTLIKITIAMGVIGSIIAVLLYSSAPFLITHIHGSQYAPAIEIVQILSVTLLLFFINAPLSTTVQASNIVRQFLPFGIANTIINVILNLLFVPKFGLIAAAWVMTATEFTGLIINLYFVQKINRIK